MVSATPKLRAMRDWLERTFGASPDGMWLADTPEDVSWQASWTVFYWGWWLAWTPFVSLFVARISKGRSVREFVLAVMLVPSLVILLWMSVLGGSGSQMPLGSDPLDAADLETIEDWITDGAVD